MIIIKLQGGLGNQLFQYAFGRALAIRRNTTCKLDLTAYSISGYNRKYLLDQFAITVPIATPSEINRLKNPYGVLSKVLRKIKSKATYHNTNKFNPKAYNISGDAYLQGFWETEKYFKDIEPIIRKEFTLKNGYGIGAQKVKQSILSAGDQSVSLHVRRTDVSGDTSNPHYGMTEPYYYKKAVERIRQSVPNPLFFIFSDDIEWCKTNIIPNEKVVFVTGQGLKDYEELFLMSECRHHIIANSTFSWWAAWLNPRADKTVIAPKHWIRGPIENYKDTVPESWITIDNIENK